MIFHKHLPPYVLMQVCMYDNSYFSIFTEHKISWSVLNVYKTIRLHSERASSPLSLKYSEGGESSISPISSESELSSSSEEKVLP